jgi:peptidase E
MTTKYILHGGFADQENRENDIFFREILKDTPNNLKVLLVLFSAEDNKVEEYKKRDLIQFEKNKGNKNISYEVAQENNVASQARNADIIYIHGGKTLKLLNTLLKESNLAEAFKGKVVTGESAGAYVLSTYFYSKTVGTVTKGLGLVPFKTICHFEGKNVEKLESLPAELETLLLPEFKFKVFFI